MSQIITDFENKQDEMISVFGGESLSIQELVDEASNYLSTLPPAEQNAAAIYLNGFFESLANSLDDMEDEEEGEEEEED